MILTYFCLGRKILSSWQSVPVVIITLIEVIHLQIEILI